MELTLITDHPVYRETLKKALSGAVETVNQYDTIDQIPLDALKSQKSVALCVITATNYQEAAKFAQKQDCFAVLADNLPENATQKTSEEFLAVFIAPVRLGQVAQSIKAYIHQRQQRSSLKPLELAHFVLDPRTNLLEDKTKKSSVRLTEKEQDILLYLYAHQSKPVGRQELLDHVWGYAQNVETHTLETHIYRLRQKVEADPAAPTLLLTNDQGYYLNI